MWIKSNQLQRLSFLFIGLSILISCESEISPELETVSPVLVVDAWLNNKPGAQHIRLTQTQPYFESVIPPGVSGAVVEVLDDQGHKFTFNEDSANKGDYVWAPFTNAVFGEVGRAYKLSIHVNGESYASYSSMRRVPVIDSLTLAFEAENSFQLDSYIAEFWSTDLAGPNDTYWVKAWKNGVLLNKPSELNLAYDAGFSPGGNFDGVQFITPIRRGIDPFETDDTSGKMISPYQPGDSLHVEIHSITLESYNFLNEVSIQTNRPGGFSELFASPLSNVSTNIINVGDSTKQVLGFFNTAAVSQASKRFKK